MTPDQIERFGRWMYEFDLGDGVKTPLYLESLRAVHAVRHDMIFGFLDAIGFDYASATALDIACNEGYFLFELLKRGLASGVGLEGRAENVAKANFIKDHLHYPRAELRETDVLSTDFGTAAYDIVLLLGIVYHVENPIGLIRRAAAASRRYLVVETQLCRTDHPIKFGWGIPDHYHESRSFFVVHDERNDNPLATMGGLSLIPSLDALVQIMRHCGFRSIVQLHPRAEVSESQYERIDRVMVVGIK